MGGAAGGFNTLAVIQAGRDLERSTIPSAMAAIAMLYTLGSIAGPVISGAMIELPQKTAMIMEFMTIAVLLLLLMVFRPGKRHTRKLGTAKNNLFLTYALHDAGRLQRCGIFPAYCQGLVIAFHDLCKDRICSRLFRPSPPCSLPARLQRPRSAGF